MILPALISPTLAFVVAALSVIVIYRILANRPPGFVSRGFRLGQVLSSGLLSLSHGTNDGQKTMGVITLALVAHGSISATHLYVPIWVIASAATAMGLGTYAGGWRIIKTTGMRILNMNPAQGFAAQGAGAAVILAVSHFGFPISTTHVINGGVWLRRRAEILGRALGGGGKHRDCLAADAARRGAGRGRRVWDHPDLRAGCGRAAGRPDRGAGCGRRRDAPDHESARAGGLHAVRILAAPIITGDTVLKLVLGALVAGLGVTLAFSLLIYCADRAGTMRRADRRGAATLFQAASVLAVLAVGALVAYGLILMAAKPK